MTERLIHKRTKGPASTPAQRLVELQNALSRVESLLAEETTKVETAERELAKYRSFGLFSFGGIEAAQYLCETLFWEALLNANGKLRAIFELGTWTGGFSWWLWAQSQARDMAFATYDSVVPERVPPGFERIDVFADYELLGERMRDLEPCVVFCDNGNKPRELRMFSRELTSRDSLLVVHDWGAEFLASDIPDNVEMVYGDFCEELGSLSRAFRIKE